MNLTILILTIFGIIFSRDIYFFIKRFFKLVDERLFFLAKLIKKVFNFINTFLRNIFGYLDKKFKFKKFFLSLELFFEKFWNEYDRKI